MFDIRKQEAGLGRERKRIVLKPFFLFKPVLAMLLKTTLSTS
jgi:hypothetical protein